MKCAYCGCEGGRSRGHHDAFWATCAFCEGTGKPKFKKCSKCNKYGEVNGPADKDHPLGTALKCTTCGGSAMVLLTKDELKGS